ncbi:MAG: DUF1211 domain-containing protein [Saprospiraceae bacterium]|uniref:DUF1211 domain-containing protein n=1 Tax=Candidatus Opimibacter skivensis TaxID=2982028 RepID=A0A9D7SS38_9BACT|nr:DUF1211 domain-containing protein [Candidatus Opimibacter skivensis]
MMHNPTARLETFCDGVFAIAITLLILEIKVPTPDTINSVNTLFEALKAQWPSWFAFLLSFGTILIAWSNHHGAFRLVDKSSPPFNFTNGFFLLTIVILPYPTSILAEYIDTDSAKTAVMLYCSTIVLQNIAWTLLFQSMLKPKDLSTNLLTRKIILETRVRCIYGFIVYLIINTIAYWFPMIALGLMGVLWCVWIYVGATINEIDTESD